MPVTFLALWLISMMGVVGTVASFHSSSAVPSRWKSATFSRWCSAAAGHPESPCPEGGTCRLRRTCARASASTSTDTFCMGSSFPAATDRRRP